MYLLLHSLAVYKELGFSPAAVRWRGLGPGFSPGGRSPSPRAVTCCLPRHAFVGNWNRSEVETPVQPLCMACGVPVCALTCSPHVCTPSLLQHEFLLAILQLSTILIVISEWRCAKQRGTSHRHQMVLASIVQPTAVKDAAPHKKCAFSQNGRSTSLIGYIASPGLIWEVHKDSFCSECFIFT